MSQYPSDPSDPFATPPASRGNMDFGDVQPPKSWPKVIGIISIVYGSLGIICNGCGLVQIAAGPAMQNWAKGMVPPEQAAQMANAPAPGILQIAVTILSFFWAILLIVAGSALAARKAKGRMLHLLWAGVAMIFWVISLAVTIQTLNAQKAQLQQQFAAQSAPGAPSADAMMPMIYATAGCMMLFFLIYPVFILIWFGLIKRDTREITAGTPEPTL